MVLRRDRAIISAIRSDRTRGASQLAVVALEVLLKATEAVTQGQPPEFRERLLELVFALKKVRPSMLVIANVMQIWEDQFELIYHGRQVDMAHAVAEMTRTLITDLSRASSDSARQMAALVESGDIIMTHSLSSTVKQFFSFVEPKGISAIVTESRPLREGRKLAEHLSELQINTTIITDAQMGLWCQQATRIVIGADCVLNDGSVVNKAGTLLLALAAREFGIPFYTCCESYKLVKAAAGELEIEEMQASELELESLPAVQARNVYFDVTPAKLITAWVTESGPRYQW